MTLQTFLWESSEWEDCESQEGAYWQWTLRNGTCGSRVQGQSTAKKGCEVVVGGRLGTLLGQPSTRHHEGLAQELQKFIAANSIFLFRQSFIDRMILPASAQIILHTSVLVWSAYYLIFNPFVILDSSVVVIFGQALQMVWLIRASQS